MGLPHFNKVALEQVVSTVNQDVIAVNLLKIGRAPQ